MIQGYNIERAIVAVIISDYITDYTINLVYAPRDEPRTHLLVSDLYIYTLCWIPYSRDNI